MGETVVKGVGVSGETDPAMTQIAAITGPIGMIKTRRKGNGVITVAVFSPASAARRLLPAGKISE